VSVFLCEAVGENASVAAIAQLDDQETQMIKRVIKSVVPGVFLTALLLTLPAPTQVSAQTGMGGGAGAGASGAGAAGGGYGGGFIYHPDQDSSYASTQPGWPYPTKRLSTKATKKHRKAM
jgi:hypothetical protein